jgi:crotonobetainyl-CoA:carnitine CoA-transferase CaiB-like acyl-CoA transferase
MRLELQGVPSVRSPMRFSEAGLQMDKASPKLGADTKTVLSRLPK